MIKLLNGETLLAKVIENDNEHLCINDPVMIEITPTQGGNAMTSISWIPLMKPTNLVALKQSHILTVYDVTDELGLYYRKSVALLKNDPEEIKKVVDEIRKQQEMLSSIAGDEEEEDEDELEEIREKVFNKLKLIRSQTSNTVH
jgi:hypothetical protein